MTVDHKITPVRGEPEATAAEPCDEYCDADCVHHTASVGWDLSFGSRINFHPRDTSDPRLVISLQLSDDAVAKGMVYREVTPQQVATYGQQLLSLTGAPTHAELMSLIYRYALARIMANASVPTKSQREVAAIVAGHERDEREVARLETEIATALGRSGLK
jgi:hypothetical protein